MRTRSNVVTNHKNGLSLAKRQQHEHVAVDKSVANCPTTTASSGDKVQDCKRIIMETRLKTPKSERKKEVHTPLHTEFLFSQHFDSQVEVGWDCNSPDTIRGLRKLSGDHKTNIPDIFMQLIADEPDPTEPRRGTPPLLGIWDKSDNDTLHAKESRNLRPRRRGRRKSAKESTGSRDLLQQLSSALDQCAQAGEKDDGSAQASIGCDFSEDKTENSAPNLDNSGDLFDTTHIEKAYNGKPKLRVSPRLVERNKTGTTSALDKIEESNTSADDSAVTERRISGVSDLLWSDDENFDDSFIIKGTQFTDDKVKFSPMFGVKRKPSGDSVLPKSKCSRYTFQLGDEDKSHAKEGVKTCGTVSREFTSLSRRVSKHIEPSSAKSAFVKHTSTESVPKHTDHDHPHAGKVNTVKSAESSNCTNTVGQDGVTLNNNKCKPVPVSCVGKSDKILNTIATTKPFASKAAVIYGATSVSRSTPTVVSNITTSAAASKNHSFRKHNSFSGQGSVGNSMCEPVRQRYLSGNVVSQSKITTDHKFTFQTSSDKSTSRLKCSTGYQRNTGNTCQQAALVSSKPAALSSRSSASASSSVLFCANSTSRCAPKANVSKNSTVTSNIRNVNLSTICETATVKQQLSDGVFDTSLSDDLLFQLAEPDDALDSQVYNVTWTTAVTESSTRKPRAKEQRNSHSMLQGQACLLVPDWKEQNLPACKPSEKHAPITKTTGRCAGNGVPVHVEGHVTRRGSSNARPAASVGAAQYRAGPTRPGHGDKGMEPAASAGFAVFSDDVFSSDDDLFEADSLEEMMGDDDGLNEPQILAMLDEAEMLATQQKSSSEKLGSGSDHGGSQEKHSSSQPGSQERTGSQGQGPCSLGNTSSQGQQPNSQGKQPTSQGKPSSHGQQHSSQGKYSSQGKQLNSQGKPSSQGSEVATASQMKYSPQEIERKKREALERRCRRAMQKPPQDNG